MDREEAHAKSLHNSGRILIHWPVCDGLRTCDLIDFGAEAQLMVADKDIDLDAEGGLRQANLTFGDAASPGSALDGVGL